MKKNCCLICFLCFCALFAGAQEYEYVVLLKDSSVVKGATLEKIPEPSIRVKTRDAKEILYRMEDVLNVSKERSALDTYIAGGKEYDYVVTLKDSTVVRGVSVEKIPEPCIRITTASGNTLLYKMDYVLKISKEQVYASGRAYKNPTKALLLSLVIPGLGQAYNQDYAKAVLMLGIEGVSWWAVSSYGTTKHYGHTVPLTTTEKKNGLYYTGIGVIICNRIWSAFNAPYRSKVINSKNKVNLTLQPDFRLDGLGGGMTNPVLGAKLSLNFR